MAKEDKGRLTFREETLQDKWLDDKELKEKFINLCTGYNLYRIGTVLRSDGRGKRRDARFP